VAQSNPSPERSPYDILGGDAALRRLVERFYARMDGTPEYYGVRKLHPESLAGSPACDARWTTATPARPNSAPG
jgi:truncated hemoglobin YjbI